MISMTLFIYGLYLVLGHLERFFEILETFFIQKEPRRIKINHVQVLEYIFSCLF